jgi:hypothetical protein
MIPRTAILLASLLCLPSLGAAQAPLGPLAAPALPRMAAPLLAPSGRSADARLPLPMEAREPLQKSRLHRSIPLAAVLGVGGLVVGYGSGLVLLGCQDESSGCESAPDNSEYALAALGLALGASMGAHHGGRRAKSEGDRWITIAAAAAGALPLIIGSASDNDTLILGSTALSITAAVGTDHFVRRPW